LSEQQLVDCSKPEGDHGCNGGYQKDAFKYNEKNPLETESQYPYTGRDGNCKSSKSAGGIEIKTYENVASNNPTALQTAVAKQPVSVSIEADKSVFQSYHSGIITSTACGTNLDHAVLVVGYGTDKG
jgi:C1A family cysteine protease